MRFSVRCTDVGAVRCTDTGAAPTSVQRTDIGTTDPLDPLRSERKVMLMNPGLVIFSPIRYRYNGPTEAGQAERRYRSGSDSGTDVPRKKISIGRNPDMFGSKDAP